MNLSKCKPLQLALLLMLAAAFALQAQQHSQFPGSSDIGRTKKGSTAFNPQTGAYRVTGGGEDIGGASDDLHFSWVQLSGDATLTADVHFPSNGVDAHEKAALLFRQTLNPVSPSVEVAINGAGKVALQYRTLVADDTHYLPAPGHPTSLRIERKLNTFTAYAGPDEAHLTQFASVTVPFPDNLYIGLGVSSHSEESLQTVIFLNVQLQRGAAKR